MSTILINSTNLAKQNNPLQNKFEYKIPSDTTFFDGTTVSLANFSIYNSFYNISSNLGNNTFRYVWNIDTPTTHNITIPDGFYDIAGINYFIQYTMLSNNHYMIDSNGDFVYFIELVINNTAYATNLRFSQIPTSAEATTLSWTQPISPGWVFPASDSKTPEFIIGEEFGQLFGFAAGTFPSIVTDDITIQSSLNGRLQNVNSIIITTNLIDSPMSKIRNLLDSINLTVEYGKILQYKASMNNDQLVYPGGYSTIVISLFNEKMQPLNVIDIEGFLMTLIIKTPPKKA